MIDIQKIVADLLKDVAAVSLQFSDTNTTFPLITIEEVDNRAELALSGSERLSSIEIQIDVWDKGKTREQTEQLADEVCRIMAGRGFLRKSSATVPSSPFFRRTMRFEAIVDVVTGMVYRRK